MNNEFVIELCGREYTLTPPILIPGQNPDRTFLEALHNAQLKPAPTEAEKKAKRDRELREQAERRYIYRQKRFNEAIKISSAEWGDQPIYCPYDRGSTDGFFRNIAEYLEYEEDEVIPAEERSSFVWATKPIHLSVDVDHIIENALDDMYEGAGDELKGVDELTQAIDAFLKANEHIVSYSIDYSRAIIIDRVSFWNLSQPELNNE